MIPLLAAPITIRSLWAFSGVLCISSQVAPSRIRDWGPSLNLFCNLLNFNYLKKNKINNLIKINLIESNELTSFCLFLNSFGWTLIGTNWWDLSILTVAVVCLVGDVCETHLVNFFGSVVPVSSISILW